MIKGIDYTGVTCGCLCFDTEGRLLLYKRSKQCRDEQGTWEVPGGSMNFGENLEQNVRREVFEECNAVLEDLRLIDTASVSRSKDGVPTHWILFVWRGTVTSISDVKINEPQFMDEIGWFDLDNLPSPLHSTMAYKLEVARRKGVILDFYINDLDGAHLSI